MPNNPKSDWAIRNHIILLIILEKIVKNDHLHNLISKINIKIKLTSFNHI